MPYCRHNVSDTGDYRMALAYCGLVAVKTAQVLQALMAQGGISIRVPINLAILLGIGEALHPTLAAQPERETP